MSDCRIWLLINNFMECVIDIESAEKPRLSRSWHSYVDVSEEDFLGIESSPRVRAQRYVPHGRPPRCDYELKLSKENYCLVERLKHWAVKFGDSLEVRFCSLASRWKAEIGPDSSLSNITNNMNYLRIIAMGEEAIPLILRELQREPAPWFVALRAITGEDSVDRDFPGNFRKKADAWLRWGFENGYIDEPVAP
jgi:hypothetical protein